MSGVRVWTCTGRADRRSEIGRPIRVLFIGHTYLLRVNQQKLIELSRYRDLELHLLTPRRWHGDLFDIDVERIESTDETPIIHHVLNTWLHHRESWYIYSPACLQLIKRLQPDIIHCEQGAFALSYAQVILGKRLFAPHAKVLFFTWVNLPYHFTGLKAAVEQFNLRHSDCAVAGNQAAKQILLDHGFRRPIHIMPQLGVDLTLYRREDAGALRRRLGLTASFIVGFLGRIDHQKGVLVLVRALAQLRDRSWQALLVGNGKAEDDVRRVAGELGILDRFMFAGAVRNDEVPRYFNCVDVSVLPSLTTPRWMEQFGHTIIEAMACEVPVIGSDSGEIPHVIGEAGLVAREGDVQDLTEKLRQVMEDTHLRQDLIAKGKRRVTEQFTHAMIAQRTYQVYLELMGRP